MSSPPHVPLRLRALDAPNWVLCLLAAVAVTATVVVAGFRHADAEVATPATTLVAGEAHLPPRAEVPVSRYASRRDAALALERARALAQRRHAEKVARRKAAERRAAERRAERKRAAQRRAVERQESRMPQAASDAGETVAAAERSTFNVPGHCLEWSREQAGIPSKYADAATAWEHAIGRRPADMDPPRGAAVYWVGGSNGYGHIAISVGDGKVRSTDAGGSGEVATVRISKLSSEWNLQYAGWADSINGYRIPGVPAR